MKPIKLTRAKLDELIKEEMDKLYERWGTGLASTSIAYKPTPKVYEDEPTEAPIIDVEGIEDIPPAFDPSVNPNSKIRIELDPLELTEEAKFNEELQAQVKRFQSWWRSLNTDVRYAVEKWLRKALIKRLTHEEVSELVSKTNAATKAYTEPKEINRKPK